MARDIVHSIEIHADPKMVYDTVATRSGLAAFWTADPLLRTGTAVGAMRRRAGS